MLNQFGESAECNSGTQGDHKVTKMAMAMAKEVTRAKAQYS
jgi:hypothetical protein